MKIQNANNSEYLKRRTELKSKIQLSQLKAALSVNKELLNLYWELGKSISLKISKSNWGTSVVEQFAKDLKEEFPNQKGFSRSNLFSMKQWFEFYATSTLDMEKIQQFVGQIPWGHNVAIITKSKSEVVAEYALRGMTQPIGIAEYELSKAIPKDLKSDLPTIEKIEKELAATLAKKS